MVNQLIRLYLYLLVFFTMLVLHACCLMPRFGPSSWAQVPTTLRPGSAWSPWPSSLEPGAINLQAHQTSSAERRASSIEHRASSIKRHESIIKPSSDQTIKLSSYQATKQPSHQSNWSQLDPIVVAHAVAHPHCEQSRLASSVVSLVMSESSNFYSRR